MFKQLSLSHYHVTCPNKFELAQWYEKKLGFQIINDVEALGEKDGPIFISADEGKSGIAIFTKVQETAPALGIKCIPAFEASPEFFIEFYKRQIKETPDLIIYDHLVSYSIYIADPVGTKIEILSTQYFQVGELLKNEGISFKRMNPSHDPDYRKI